jgi:hypothetical protein
MPRRTGKRSATLGFRVKTGRAIVVALAGPAANPRILYRREVQLCDPKVPESHQPYHSGVMPFAPASAKAVARGRKAAERVSIAVMKSLKLELEAEEARLAAVTLVVASKPNLAKLASAHVRAHALEGILFREVLEVGARACRVPSAVVLEREAAALAAAALRRPEGELRRSLAEFGAQIGRPWRAEEKSAALGAWLALASHTGRSKKDTL